MHLKISPHTHPESPISGSTVERMVDYAAKLGRTHFAYTDPAYMTSLFRAFRYINKKYKDRLRLIPGVEIFFKDPSCAILKGSQASKAKYFKLTLYARTQEQFNKLSMLVSREKSDFTTYYGETYPLWKWADLEEAASYGLVACSSDVHDMVGKHILTETPKLGELVFLRLKELFKDLYFVSIVGNEVSRTWVSLTEFKLKNGTRDVIPSSSTVHTNAARMTKAEEIVTNPNKHRRLLSYTKNFMSYTVGGEKGSEVLSAKNHEGFLKFPRGDVQLLANKFMFALAKRHDVRVLYSDYSFYAEPDDKIVQDVRLSQDNIKEHASRHMQSSEEASLYLSRLGLKPEEISLVESNQDLFTGLFDSFDLVFDYSIPEVEGGGVALNKCIEIIQKTGRLKQDPVYLNRLKYEIEVLAKNGKVDLTPYFLPIRDVLDHYRKNGRLVGPARGSAGGSLFMYLMGITHIDPIKYDLSFERFLSIDRILTGNWPDVDVDLVDRELLVGTDGKSGYLYSRWGNRAAQISTRIQLRLKSAIKDVNRFLKGTVEPDIEKLSKSLSPPPQGVSDKDYVFGFEDSDGNHIPGLIEVNKELQEYAATRPDEWAIVQKCLGISRQNSKHASAFVIADKPISQVVPTFMGNITQYEAKEVEDCKLIKYDFLVVNQLKDIEGCLNRINKKAGVKNEAGYFRHDGKDLYIWDLPEEQPVMESVWDGNTETLFQINTQSMVPFVQKIKPKSIVDLATILALVRPGPLDFVDPETGLTMAEEYVERRQGRGTVKIPELSELLPETYGVQCFQEQNTKVAKQIGKMKPTDAEELRRVFSKKQKAKALAMKPLFMEGAVGTVGQEKAEMIWSQMETSSRYSFNLSHASAYAMITYACMYLRHHYPLEWWAAVLTNASEDEISTNLFKHVRDKVTPPDINLSTNEMEIDYETKSIRAKLTVLRGLGEAVAGPIVENRPYKDIKDFVKKKVAGPALIRKLIHVGVMDSLFPKNTSLLNKMQSFEDTLLEVAYEQKIAEGKNPKKPAPSSPQEVYMSLSPIQDAKMRKQVLPTLPIKISSIVAQYSKMNVGPSVEKAMFVNSRAIAVNLIDGDQFFDLESRLPLNRSVNFCTVGFVVDAKEFYFSKNTKKALKLVVDIDGRISERVMWPAWGTDHVSYPNDIGKGSIILMFMGIREHKEDIKLFEIKLVC